MVFELQDVFLLMVVAVALLLWWETLAVKELALQAVRKQCQQHELQLLDQSIALRKFWLRRNNQGRVVVQRVYQFEFSYTGEERNRGQIEMLGRQVGKVNLDAYPVS